MRAGGRSYAIPSSMVAQVQELRPEGLENLRASTAIPTGSASATATATCHACWATAKPARGAKFNWVLLLRRCPDLALHVDALRGNQEVVIKNAGPHIARIVGISGATVLGDGEIVLILNPVALASRADIGPTRTPSCPLRR